MKNSIFMAICAEAAAHGMEITMEQKISWASYVFDEMKLVYEKAAQKESAGKLMEQLEEKAMQEAKENYGLLTTSTGSHLTPEQFDGLPESSKETVIKMLAGLGLQAIDSDISSATISIRLSARIQDVMACTIFDILNRLEKLDGAINMLHPKWTLELQVPLGGRKGLL